MIPKGAIPAPILPKDDATIIRHKRSQLLAQCDWTQLSDAPLTTKELWVAYRQALRDITAQAGFPQDVIWPVPPA